MTPAPTPQHAHDHGAAGFCTDHAQPPDERVETMPRVREVIAHAMSRETHNPMPYAVTAAAVVAALDDETECSVCSEADEVRADAPRHAGWIEAMRFAHHAHADETSNGYMSANGVLGAGPDAVIVDGDWLAQVEADLAEARAALDRARAGINDAIPYLGERELAEPILRAALDPEEPR